MRWPTESNPAQKGARQIERRVHAWLQPAHVAAAAMQSRQVGNRAEKGAEPYCSQWRYELCHRQVAALRAGKCCADQAGGVRSPAHAFER
jgi:hypothetical protein